MLAEYNGAYYEPLSLAMVRMLLGSPPVKALSPEFAPEGYPDLEWLQVACVALRMYCQGAGGELDGDLAGLFVDTPGGRSGRSGLRFGCGGRRRNIIGQRGRLRARP